jgi:hypothetical protein
MNQEQPLKPSRFARERIFEGASVAMGFQVAEGLLDLHAAGVVGNDRLRAQIGKRERGSQNHGSLALAAILRL